MPAYACVPGDDRIRRKEAGPKAAEVKVGRKRVVRTALITPFRIRDDRIVVIDELAAKTHADPLSFRIACFQVCELEVPGIFIGYTDRRFLKERPRVLNLA